MMTEFFRNFPIMVITKLITMLVRSDDVVMTLITMLIMMPVTTFIATLIFTLIMMLIMTPMTTLATNNDDNKS